MTTPPQVTVADLERFEGEYRGSVEEREDLRKAYLEAEGNMGQVLLTLPPPLPLPLLPLLSLLLCRCWTR